MESSFSATGRNTPLIGHLPNNNPDFCQKYTAFFGQAATRSPPLELSRRAHPLARAAGGEARSTQRATGPAPRSLAEDNCTFNSASASCSPYALHRRLCSAPPGPNKAAGWEVRTAGKHSRGTAGPRGVAVQPLHEPTPPSTHGVRLHHELTPAGHDRHGVAGGRPRPRHLATAGESPSESPPRGAPAGRGLPGRR